MGLGEAGEIGDNGNIAECKMCGVVPQILARGPLRAPVASPKPTVWPLDHQSGRVPAPRHPMTKERACPFGTQPLPEGPTLRGLDARQRFSAEPWPWETWLSPTPSTKERADPSIPTPAEEANVGRCWIAARASLPAMDTA